LKAIITGGGGFLGNRLARALADRGKLTSNTTGDPESVREIVLFDRVIGEQARAGLEGMVRFVEGDIGDRDQVFALIEGDAVSVFHLASMVSGECEANFDEALRVNLDGGRHVFEACRALGSHPRVVFASSVAAFGGDGMPPAVGDATKRNPQTTYGMTKVIGELMVNDYSRRGFIDGRAARLPTVIIRPGRPNAAASSFASSVFREPLNGEPCQLPVPRDQRHPVIGYRTVVESFIALHEVDAGALGSDRSVTLPSLEVSVAEMIAALEDVAARRGIALGPVTDRPDPAIQAIVRTWPTATEAARARALGMPAPGPLAEIIEAYLDDFGGTGA
jgi:nucleoside-diphosphate-sugar epimerase